MEWHDDQVFRLRKEPIVADVSNVAYYLDLEAPNIRNIDLMFRTVKKKNHVVGMVDWSTVDNLYPYKEYFWERYLEERRFIAIEYADPLIIERAQYYNCKILSNDQFRDSAEYWRDPTWFLDHRISFKIEDGQFLY